MAAPRMKLSLAPIYYYREQDWIGATSIVVQALSMA